MEEKRVLITGGSGLIGKYLTQKLTEAGYQVSWVSRTRGNNEVKTYVWDIENNSIEDEAILNADFIIHLAGANLFEKAWSEKFKNEIIVSRTKSAKLLLGKVKIFEQPLKAFISASGIAFYGADTKNTGLTESSPKGEGFLSDVVEAWEESAENFSRIGIRSVQLRTGIVLSPDGGPLKKFVTPIKFWLGAALGTGSQFVSWIHIEDLARIFINAIEDSSIEGPVNAVSPDPKSNKDFLKACAKALKKPFFLPNIPPGILEIFFGKEKASVILGGNKVIPEVLQKKGFIFAFPTIDSALNNLLQKRKA